MTHQTDDQEKLLLDECDLQVYIGHHRRGTEGHKDRKKDTKTSRRTERKTNKETNRQTNSDSPN
jgi:hypothetical protein